MAARFLCFTVCLVLLVTPTLALPSAATRGHLASSRTGSAQGRPSRSLRLLNEHLRTRGERQIVGREWTERECMQVLRGGGPISNIRNIIAVIIKLPFFWLPWVRAPVMGVAKKISPPSKKAAPPPPPPPKQTLRDMYFKVVEYLTLLFPVWTVLLQGIAFSRPQAFAWLSTDPVKIGKTTLPFDLYSAFLTIIMFSMGTTLTFDDFAKVQSSAWPISVAFVLQYGLTPLIASLIGVFLEQDAMRKGLMVLACSPGSQASNVACFIAGCDLPVSILMTWVSTMASAVMTPLLLTLYLSTPFETGFAMAAKVVKVTLAPIAAGLLVNQYLPAATAQIKPISPLLMVVLTSCLCATPIAGVAQQLSSKSIVPVLSLQALAFVGGYLIPRFVLDMGEKMSRTISIETGMQSAALGYLLATQHFGDNAAVPSAFGILSMSVLGSAVAVAWRLAGC